MLCGNLSDEEVNRINQDNNRYSKHSRLLNSLGIILNTLGSTVILAYTLATFHKKPQNDIVYQQVLLEISLILIIIGCLLALVSIGIGSKVQIDITHQPEQTNTIKSLFSGRTRRRSVGTNMTIRSNDGITSASERNTIASLFSGGRRRSVGTNYTTASDGSEMNTIQSIFSTRRRTSMTGNTNRVSTIAENDETCSDSLAKPTCPVDDEKETYALGIKEGFNRPIKRKSIDDSADENL